MPSNPAGKSIAMPQRNPGEALSEERRKEIFRSLVDAQDLYEFTAAQARQLIAKRFALSEVQVQQIEREGRERLWPPF
jgi:hypothetical protein